MDENESITKELRELIEEHWPHSNPTYREGEMKFAPKLDAITDRIDKQVDALKADNAELQARLDASMPLPVDADGIPCHIGDLLETEHHIPRKAVGYYLAYESTPCVTLDFISLSIKASRLHHVAPEPPKPPDSQERIADDLDAWCDRTDVDGDACGELRELADRIRRLVEREDER